MSEEYLKKIELKHGTADGKLVVFLFGATIIRYED